MSGEGERPVALSGGERPGLRRAVDRVAEQIRDQRRQDTGRDIGHEAAKSEALRRAEGFERRQEDRKYKKR